MRRNTSAADLPSGSGTSRRESVRSVRRDCFPREQCSPFVPVMAKPHWRAKPRVTMRRLLPGNYQTKVMLLRQLPAKPLLLELQVHLKDSRLLRQMETPAVRARAHQYLRGPDPCAFFLEVPDAEKCNPAARCGDLPTSARCHRRCNRHGFVGYGNRHSRLLHTRARPAGTFLIAGADKCLSPLRRFED